MAHRTQDHGEVELKFDLDRRAARKVRRHGLLSKADHQSRPLNSVYFDTDDGAIHKAGYSLRVRQEGECFTQTVKSDSGSAGLHDRGEWEARIDQPDPDPKAFNKTPLRKLKKLKRRIEPTVCSDVDRTSWLIDYDHSVVEAVLDSGTVGAADQEASFHELELELRAGKPAALFDVARQLGQAAPLEIGVLSKEQRGRMLGDGSLDRAHKASEVGIHSSMNAGQAFATIVHECLRHFRLNEALIIAERDCEALHQARVAMRRLMTAFLLFRPAIQQGSLEPLRVQLRIFIRPFGEARNLDVFLAHHGEGLGWRDRRKLGSARADAYEQVIASLDGQQSRELMLDLVQWTASDDWRKDAASAPIDKFAARRLDRMWKKVRRKGARLGDLEEKQLHRLRINIKELRYAVEFLGPLYKRKRVRKFASSLEAMQDCLGLMHDDMVSRQIVDDFALGDAARTNIVGRARQLKAMEKRFVRLKRVGRFWART